jgi:transposase
MPRRKVKLAVKVKALRENLRLIDAKAIARKYGVSERAVYNWYHRVLEALPEILAEELPGPKPTAKSESESPPFKSWPCHWLGAGVRPADE